MSLQFKLLQTLPVQRTCIRFFLPLLVCQLEVKKKFFVRFNKTRKSLYVWSLWTCEVRVFYIENHIHSESLINTLHIEIKYKPYKTYDNIKVRKSPLFFANFNSSFSIHTEADTRSVLCKKVFLELSQNSQENIYARVSFLIKWQASALRPATLLKKKLWHRCFPVILRNI